MGSGVMCAASLVFFTRKYRRRFILKAGSVLLISFDLTVSAVPRLFGGYHGGLEQEEQ